MVAESHQYECTGEPNDGLRIVHMPRKTTLGIIPGIIWCWTHGEWDPIPEEWLTEEKPLRKEILTEWLAIRAGKPLVFLSDALGELVTRYTRFRFWRPVDLDDRYSVYRFIDDLTKYAPVEEGKTHG